MGIKSITIENFKSIGHPVKIELAPITLLFGQNSVGKSSIFQAFHYTREILERSNVDADHVAGADESLNLGGSRILRLSGGRPHPASVPNPLMVKTRSMGSMGIPVIRRSRTSATCCQCRRNLSPFCRNNLSPLCRNKMSPICRFG